jgi:hypothetical protein
MIYNNFVSDSTVPNYIPDNVVVTAHTWNKAWGFEGTAKSLYDLVGAHQSAIMTYSTFSWTSGKQQITAANTTIQYSFITSTYPSSSRDGDLNNWFVGMSPALAARDSIVITRDGYYILQADVAMNDVSNRIGSSTNTDGIESQLDRKLNVTIRKDAGANTFSKSYQVVANTIKAATGNGPQFVQPYFVSNQTLLTYATKGDRFTVRADVMSNRTDRIVYSSLKAFLIKNNTNPSEEFNAYNYFLLS